MFGSSSGEPYWHQPTTASPSRTIAACALPSRTSRCFSARLPSALTRFSGESGWNHTHQHPPHTPLCFSTSAAHASHVAGSSALIV